jgi:mannose-6-phosphate isomerase-like protein (cupin superfamily)
VSPAIRNDDCDQILYVLRNDREAVGDSSQGQAQSAPPLDQDLSNRSHPEGVRESAPSIEIFIDGRSFKISADTGIYIRPKQTFAINNPGPDSIVIVSSQCPDPDREPVFVHAPNNSSMPTGRTTIVQLADQKAQPTADRWYRVLVDDEVGSEQVTQFVGSIPPGRAPDHFHNYEEVLFILKGQGRVWAGDTNTPIAEGSCIYLPKGQVHCVENTGKVELRLLGVFYPAGSPSVRYDV